MEKDTAQHDAEIQDQFTKQADTFLSRHGNSKDGLLQLMAECAGVAAGFPQVVGIGVNCTQPALMPALIAALRGVSGKPVLVYPNSGEGWDAEARAWTGKGDPASFGAMAAEWYAAGAQVVGGCCRTRPAHIAQVAEAAGRLRG